MANNINPKVLCIDPGLGGSGFAIFDYINFNSSFPSFPEKTKVKTLKTTDKYLSFVQELIEEEFIVHVYCEGQAFMQGKKGMVTARSGALVKLANFAGALEGLCYGLDINFEYVKVSDWKGQLDKEVVKQRIINVWKDHTCTTHDYDAVGIGLWKQGIINK